jgi:hypothetical protein
MAIWNTGTFAVLAGGDADNRGVASRLGPSGSLRWTTAPESARRRDYAFQVQRQRRFAEEARLVGIGARSDATGQSGT